jgi:hypothetical protein
MIKSLLCVLTCGWLVLRQPKPAQPKSYPIPAYLLCEPSWQRARMWRMN